MAKQLDSVPSDVSHLIVSIGGNDALMNIDLLGLPVTSTAEALSLFGDRLRGFEASYRSASTLRSHCAGTRRSAPSTTATSMRPRLSLARIALMMFNDVILRFAIERRISVIDLRLVCSEVADYANSIEPSGSGGRKIASAIARSFLVIFHRRKCSPGDRLFGCVKP
jgi:hypothetical protein